MDSLLFEFQKEYPKVKIAQSKNLFYGKYNNRLRLKFPRRGVGWVFRRLIKNRFPNLQTRAEGHHLSVFFKDFEHFSDFLKFLKFAVVEGRSADEWIDELSIDTLGLTGRKIHVPAIKKKGYAYKVTLQNGGQKFTPEMKQRLLDIINNNQESYKIPPLTRAWLKDFRFTSNWSSRYFYTRDHSGVTFMQLACGDIIDRVYEII
jgi:hypothetical protein